MPKCIPLLVLFLLLGFQSKSVAYDLSPTERERIMDFARLYGAVKYFHPSDEAQAIDWDAFAVLSIEQILKSNLPLKSIFKPITHELRFVKAGENGPGIADLIVGKGIRPVYWQHQGLGLGGISSGYKSVRIFDREMALFNGGVHMGVRFPVELKSREETAYVPLSLPGRNGKVIYPQAEGLPILQKELEERIEKGFNPDDASVRLAGVVISWAALYHFFPYDPPELFAETILGEALTESAAASDGKGFLLVLRRFVASLNDGHASVEHPELTSKGRLPFEMLREKGQTFVLYAEEESGLKPGDELIAIDGIEAERALADAEASISGSESWKIQKANWTIVKGKPGELISLQIKRNGKPMVLKVALTEGYPRLARSKTDFEEVVPGIWYVNLNTLAYADLMKKIKVVKNAKGWIFDLRLYPANNHEVLTSLLTEADTAKWIHTPEIMLPERSRYNVNKMGWGLEPGKTKLSGKIIFLTSRWSISYAESVIGMVKSYKLGMLVGQRTAGANGSINGVDLPGGFTVRFTGEVATLPDGRSYFGVGIDPDVPLRFDEEMLRQGKDPWIETALELLEK